MAKECLRKVCDTCWKRPKQPQCDRQKDGQRDRRQRTNPFVLTRLWKVNRYTHFAKTGVGHEVWRAFWLEQENSCENSIRPAWAVVRILNKTVSSACLLKLDFAIFLSIFSDNLSFFCSLLLLNYILREKMFVWKTSKKCSVLIESKNRD